MGATRRSVLLMLVLMALDIYAQEPIPFYLRDVDQQTARWQETALSGIDIYSANAEREIQALIRSLGNPTRQQSDAKNGTRDYYWESDGPDLKITEIRNSSARFEPRIISIEVWGRHSKGKNGMSGAGLSLGDTLADARRAYPFGFKYSTSGSIQYLPLSAGYTIGSVSNGGEYSPHFEIDFHDEVVVGMKLTNPCPYICF